MDRKAYAREWHKKYRQENKDVYNAYVRNLRDKDRDAYNRRQREWRANNMEKANDWDKARRNKLKDENFYIAQQMLSQAKQRAKRQGVPFDLKREDLIFPTVCPVLGVTFTKPSKGCGYAADTSYSLDKIVPALGYVAGNVAIISCLANRLKNSNSIETLESLLAYMKSYHPKS